MKQKLVELKREINHSKIKAVVFTPLTVIGRTTTEKVNKERQYLNNAINQPKMTAIYI